MRIALSVVTAILACGHALASGGATCSSQGGAAKVELEAGITRGMGGPVFSLSATATIQDKAIAEDLRISTFERAQLAQYWHDGEDLLFLLYRERQGDGEFGSVELEVKTRSAGDEASFAGTYLIKVFDAKDGAPATFEGRIACSVE